MSVAKTRVENWSCNGIFCDNRHATEKPRTYFFVRHMSSTLLFSFMLTKLRTKTDHVPIKHTKHYGKLDRKVSILC
jgi:hypothetical protein